MGEQAARERDISALWARMINDASVAQLAATRQTLLTVGATGVTILVGGTQQVDLVWPEAFLRPYAVDLIPMALLGKATLSVIGLDADGLATDPNGISVTVTAGLLVAAGSQFLALGRT